MIEKQDNSAGKPYKYGGRERLHYLLFSSIMPVGLDPSQMTGVQSCPVFKKGDRLTCAEYRCITFLIHSHKLFERVLETRLIQKMEP